MREKRAYIVYDGRAAFGDTDNATVLEHMGNFLKPPWKAARRSWGGMDAVLYSYRIDLGNVLSDERFEGRIK